MSIAEKLQTVAENMTKVYDAGAATGTGGDFDEGYSEGYASGELAGRENGERAFWDRYQKNGNRTDYDYAFGGAGWTDETFKPRYNINVSYGVSIFSKSAITNLKNILDANGVLLDFSQMKNCSYPFKGSAITHIGVLDMSSATHLNYFLHQAKSLEYVEKVILNSNGTQKFNETFSFGECEALEHIVFEGVIGQNGFDIHWSDLDRESLLSIISALQDKSTDTSGTVWKITLGETNKAKLTADELNVASDKGWSVE